MNINFAKYPDKLVPAIVQDAITKQVLMLGYMNKEAFTKTKAENKVTFYSRSKKRLWTKGEESGNFLDLIDILEDCDNDALLILVNPHGPTCHTGSYSCFGDEIFSFKTLEKDIDKRSSASTKESYTALLLDKGLDLITQKIEEESDEVVKAAKSETNQRVVEESADLLYHLFVLLKSKKITLEEVEDELRSRRGKRSKSLI